MDVMNKNSKKIGKCLIWWLDNIWYAVGMLTVETAPHTRSYSGLYVPDPEGGCVLTDK